jgi:dihydropyrimidinase
VIIRNGRVVTEDAVIRADILIRGETIAAVGCDIPLPPDCTVIDAAGMFVFPGGIDVHTHMNLDTGVAVASDDFYTGTVAAACGGTTTIVDHIGFGPAGCRLDHQIERYHGMADGMAVIDYGFHGVIQHVDDGVLADMGRLANEGITSYKVYLTYGFKIDDGGLFRVLEKANETGVLIAVHPENDGVITHFRACFKAQGKLAPKYHALSRPAECEAEAVNRAILLARMAGDAPLYIVHTSSAIALSCIMAARERGQRRIFAETCPQYLLLDENRYDLGEDSLKYIMCPPLRTGADNEVLWNALPQHLDTVATDHCPFMFATQKMPAKDDFTRCPSGVPGVEERMALLFSEGVQKNRITLRRFTDLTSTNPAKLFGMYPRKGVIRPGSDADLVIIDPDKQVTIRQKNLHSRVDYSVYEGLETQGWPVYTINRGEVIVKKGEFIGKKGRGVFIQRKRGVYG